MTHVNTEHFVINALQIFFRQNALKGGVRVSLARQTLMTRTLDR
jgi:hypothetical protein